MEIPQQLLHHSLHIIRKIKIGHIEAGLRTGNLFSPWPEEGNRQLTGVLADFHLCQQISEKTQ